MPVETHQVKTLWWTDTKRVVNTKRVYSDEERAQRREAARQRLAEQRELIALRKEAERIVNERRQKEAEAEYAARFQEAYREGGCYAH